MTAELQRMLSRLGVCSRTDAARWIALGRVSVDGRIVRDPIELVIEMAEITVDGRVIALQRRVVMALHKPRGVLTSHGDPEGRPTVYDLLPPGTPWVAPIGRLDADSEGLLLLTNDPELAARITEPDTGPGKTYRVTARGRLDDGQLAQLGSGVDVLGAPTKPAVVTLERRSKERTIFTIVLHEGRNRQVRRMVQAMGSKVKRLVRMAIGPVGLGELATGQVRALTDDEIAAIEAACRRN